ncbi:hypothetical protein LV84_01859 [Algoriphagus ratkowskyi]|uniref:Uncharacterized protein n=1 Tax=Algoriphagus ratkowskyi TaxID=57028 RepID=A0A2W7RH87_9BACT|nr:hypothetical protein [Algoriphagus ratkowskyi]PZX57730.1 hypothetical protein LV84_01859 [Algoriphagus ratkowskyi]
MKIDEILIAEFLGSADKIKAYSPIVKALWFDGNGDWEKAHNEVDGLDGKAAARIHAYLHRKEGDQWNADYWYRRAGEPCPDMTLDEEWAELLGRYLN